MKNYNPGTNYNRNYGSKKLFVTRKRNYGRNFLVFILLAMIVIAVIVIFMRRPPEEPVIVTPAQTSLAAPVSNPKSGNDKLAGVTAAATLPAAGTLAKPTSSPQTNTTEKASGTQSGPAAANNGSAPAETATAAAVAEKVAPPLPSDPAVTALLQQAETAFKAEKYPEARALAEQALAAVKDTDHPDWTRAATMLGRANIKIFTTDCPFPARKERYEVMTGDALTRIARKFNTTITAIQQSNGLRSFDQIQDGQILTIYKGAWNILIDKKRYRLLLQDGDKLFKLYHIGIGRQGRTPVGKFQVASKVTNPDWYSPQGKIPFGNKENVLGTRWLKLKATDQANTLRGYGIHGTWDRDSIGKDRSNGCIRMRNEDVEELYTIIPLQTTVVIEN
ncbi:MAG: L,D-transpeptidase family protein [Victivallales bacterium]|nr:L,D-transpeptidase family protein [Victivallales bacterium]